MGQVLASAFSAILVYAQNLLPGGVGTVSGRFFGLAFGMGGGGAFLPAIGLLTAFLPTVNPGGKRGGIR